jgi:hypothetical protein
MAPDLTLAFVGDPCVPTLDFVFSFLDYDYVLLTNFAIRYYDLCSNEQFNTETANTVL